MEQDQEGEEDPERIEEWVELEWEVVEEEWAVPVPEPDQEEDVSARPVELLLPISRESPVLRPDVPNAGRLWSGHSVLYGDCLATGKMRLFPPEVLVKYIKIIVGADSILIYQSWFKTNLAPQALNYEVIRGNYRDFTGGAQN